MRLFPFLLLCLLLSACDEKPSGGNASAGNSDSLSAPEDLSGPTPAVEVESGTYMDAKSKEVLIVENTGNGKFSVWYSNGRKPFQLLKILENTVSQNSLRLFTVQFQGDTKKYRLEHSPGMYAGSLLCHNPDSTTQSFDYLSERTERDFRPGRLMFDRLIGTYADTHSGELLMFARQGYDELVVHYSNGKDPFVPVELLSVTEDAVKIRFENGHVYTLTTVPSPIHTLHTSGPDGEQTFYGLFPDTDEINANVAEMRKAATEGGFAKPVTYLYGEPGTEVRVALKTTAPLAASYPEYPSQGWHMRLETNGMLQDVATGREYPSLFWETEYAPVPWSLTEGFCVRSDSSLRFLEEKLEAMGFNPRERAEFITYWMPKLHENQWSRVHFAIQGYGSEGNLSNANGSLYTQNAELNIEPKPRSLFRLLMIVTPLQAPVSLKPQALPRIPREGICVVEWGGTIVREQLNP